MTINEQTSEELLKEKTKKLFKLMNEKYTNNNTDQEKKDKKIKKLLIDYKNTDSFEYFLNRISQK